MQRIQQDNTADTINYKNQGENWEYYKILLMQNDSESGHEHHNHLEALPAPQRFELNDSYTRKVACSRKPHQNAPTNLITEKNKDNTTTVRRRVPVITS